MTESECEIPMVRLQPGEVHIGRSPMILTTLLGSCVGVTFWSQRLGLGALCHGVLPHVSSAVQGAQRYRYVDFAIRDLAAQLDRLGAHRSELQVKVFGGADVLPGSGARSIRKSVGQLNSQTALEVLKQEKLQVLASDLGGLSGRTIEFDTASGEVLVRRLHRQNGKRW